MIEPGENMQRLKKQLMLCKRLFQEKTSNLIEKSGQRTLETIHGRVYPSGLQMSEKRLTLISSQYSANK